MENAMAERCPIWLGSVPCRVRYVDGRENCIFDTLNNGLHSYRTRNIKHVKMTFETLSS